MLVLMEMVSLCWQMFQKPLHTCYHFRERYSTSLKMQKSKSIFKFKVLKYTFSFQRLPFGNDLLNIPQCSWLLLPHLPKLKCQQIKSSSSISHYSALSSFYPLMPAVKTSDQHVQPTIHVPSTSNMTDLEVFVNEALQRTGREISKRNIIKPSTDQRFKENGAIKD